MDAKINIHFKRQTDGTVLATATMFSKGVSGPPQFYRVRLDRDVDPWSVYSEIASQAIGRLQLSEDNRPNEEKPAGARKATAGRLIQLRATLPMT